MSTAVQTLISPNTTLLQRAQRIIRNIAGFEDRFFPNHQEFASLLEILREMNCAIVFTTGVWDLLHIGHNDYIQNGKLAALKHCQGFDHIIMVVGVDTDELTRRRKEGPTRPVVPMEERCRMLAHTRAVDVIVPQYEDGTLHAIVQADVRIISETTSDLPGQEVMRANCKHLLILPAQARTSTTERIRRLALDGRLEALQQVQGKLRALAEEIERDLGQP